MILESYYSANFFRQHAEKIKYSLCSAHAQSMTLAELRNFDDGRLAALDNMPLEYAPIEGSQALRAAIASMYEDVQASQVLICAGAEEAIAMAMMAIIKPGHRVIVITPCYQSLLSLPKALGADVVQHALQIVEGNFSLDVDKLLAEMTAETQCLVMNFPNNPTGMMPQAAEFNEILSVAKQRNIAIVSDEIYRYTEYEPQNRLPAAADCHLQAVSIGVVSKCLGLAGLRIGWLVSQEPEWLHRCRDIKHYFSICPDLISDTLATIALQNRGQILKKQRLFAEANLKTCHDFFSQYHDWFWAPLPMAGFVQYPRLRRDFPVEQFATELLEKTGVAVMPAQAFHCERNHFRIGFAQSTLSQALLGLERYIHITKLP